MTRTPSAPTRTAPGILLAVLMAAMAAMAAGPVFNYGVGALSATIVESYGITEGQYGFIITAVFVVAGLAAPLLGVLADRIDTRVQLTLIFGGVLVAFLLSATWQSYAMLLVAGLTFPVAGAAFGWRGAALFGALLCVPLLVTGWTVVTRLQRRARENTPTTPPAPSPAAPSAAGRAPAPPRDRPSAGLPGPTHGGPFESAHVELSDAAADGVNPGPGQVSQERTGERSGLRAAGAGAPGRGAAASSGALPTAVWLLTLTSFLNAVGTQGVNVYASLFAVRAMGYTVTVAGLLLGVMGVIGIGSRIGWGRVTGRLGRPAPLIQVMSVGGVVGLGLLVLAETTQQHWLMWLGVAFHAALPLAANVVINSGIVAAVPKERIGVASGLVATGMYLGFALGPVVVGQLVDLTEAFTAGWAAVAGAYVLCFVAALVLGRVQARRA
ncbi:MULTISPECIES: MFS transporter [unclassified Kocuria]|uniref:MFS transporter n=1 Tax=unclassified Kocuria TaxID=2649579 RepID=UPI000F87B090|nr:MULTISPECIES: MFS transporter [unclassified Kocuria]RUP82279.1 MFS transporter [Kocuria sp. HSID17590]RUQ07130.1 MFS transporter [Kocuria sp. HSID17582]